MTTLLLTGMLACGLSENPGVQGPAAEEGRWRAFAELSDGSKLYGQPSFEAISVRTSGGVLEVPLAEVGSASLEGGRWTVYTTGKDRSKSTGRATAPSYRLKTIFGTVDLPVRHIRNLDVYSTEAASHLPASEDLVLYLDCDDASGNRARNIASFRHHAQVNGAKRVREGRRGGAFQFDGNATLVIPHHSELCPKTFTFAAWVRPADSAQWRLIASKTNTSSWYGGYGFYRHPRDNDHVYFYVGNYSSGSVRQKIPQEQWTHLAGTFDGQSVTLYVNGEPSVSRALAETGTTMNHTTTPLVVGGGSGYNWVGTIDELTLYRRALSIREIERLMVATSADTKDDGRQ